MIPADQIQLIKRLKQQPRHGQIGALGDVERALSTLFQTYKQGAGEIVQLNVFGKLAGELNNIVKDLSILQDLNQGVAEDFNLNAKGAAQLGIELEKVSKKLKIDPNIVKQLVGGLRDQIAGQTKYLENQTRLGQQVIEYGSQYLDQLGQTEDMVGNITALQIQQQENEGKRFAAASEAFADVAATFEKLYDYKGGLTDISTEFGKLDAKSRNVFGRMPEQLGLALIKSKALKVEMQSITDGAKGFLSVEEAIGNELDFQLLTGEELTTLNGENLTAEMQKAVLAQDANRQVELFAGFVQKYGDQLKSNVYLQEQAANMFGVQEEDLFNAMEGIAAQSATVGKNLFQATVDAGVAAKTSFADMVKLEDERSLATKAERIESLEYYKNLKEYTPGQVEGREKAVLTGVESGMQAGGKVTEAALNMLGGGGGIISFGSRVVDLAAEVVNFATSPSTAFTRQDQDVVGPPQSANDLFLPASSGTVISGPLGSFALNAKDDVLAASGIGRAAAGGTGASAESVATAVAAALKGMSFHVTNVFDGQKIRSNLQILERSTLNDVSIS